jgi:hypothetical protein
MKTYGDLNLRVIRDACDLDFAHYTYKKGQCSCCYGPKDLPKIYWKNRIIPETNDYTYILFKNANNGSGCVCKGDVIDNYTFIEYGFKSDEQKHKFCTMLQEQLGDEYVVKEPESNRDCIIIYTLEEYEKREA